MGDVWLTAGTIGSARLANGQILSISQNQALFSLLGTTYGGNGTTTFALPDLRDVAPKSRGGGSLSYVICTVGYFPSPN
jgi:microcystin-dependent protein